MKARFQKTLIFPIDFNDSVEPRCQLGAFALVFSPAFGLALALKLRLHLHLHLQWRLNLHLHGQIRFWTAPCAKIIQKPMEFACGGNPQIIANHRKSQSGRPKRYQFVNPFD